MKIVRTALVLTALAACTHNPKQAAPSLLDLAEQRMSGQFDSRAQAARDSDYYAITLAMIPIWQGAPDVRWLYVEQATAETPNKPYRQRVYRVSQVGGEVVSAVYTLKQPERFVRGWESGRLQELRTEDIELREGCAVYLTANGSELQGGTRGQNCASELRGARWASSEVQLRDDGMTSWDRGFDAAGKQVWGAEKGAYEFIRQVAAQKP